VKPADMREEGDERGFGAYPLRRFRFYRPLRAAAFIGSVHEAVANRAPGRAPPSCFPAGG
jgi:hypothetical protein